MPALDRPATTSVLAHEVVPGQKLTWTSTLGADNRPSPADPSDIAMTAIIELQANDTGGTRYRAIAEHADVDARTQHEAMGFHKGWSTALDQLVALMTSR